MPIPLFHSNVYPPCEAPPRDNKFISPSLQSVTLPTEALKLKSLQSTGTLNSNISSHPLASVTVTK